MKVPRLICYFMPTLLVIEFVVAPPNPAVPQNGNVPNAYPNPNENINGQNGGNNQIPNAKPPANQNQQHAENKQKADPEAGTMLSEHPSCKPDVARICPNYRAEDEDDEKQDESRTENKILHNFEVLDCFMSYEGDEKPPSHNCQTLIYHYKLKLTTDDRFETAAKEVCQDLIQTHKINSHCSDAVKGGYVPCLMEQLSYTDHDGDNEKSKDCYIFLNKMERVIFSDYHLVHKFQEDCLSEIKNLDCGRLFDSTKAETENIQHHNQGPVIECLLNSDRSKLGKKCEKQIARVAELQSDDYHLDRPLFFACRHDRETFCHGVQSGEGRIYHCLMQQQQKDGSEMNKKCLAQLIKREKLIQEDVKADSTFFHACNKILTETGCLVEQDDKTHKTITMSHSLTCLMDAEAESEKELDVPDECQQEIELFQSNLMNEYKITVEIASRCHSEIESHCSGMKKAHEKDGTIHCLMAMSMPTNYKDKEMKAPISTECKAAVSELLEETRPNSIIAIDGFLLEQCAAEVGEYCEKQKYQLDCLMDHIRKGDIEQSSNCAKHLLELEYFISRNYKHDMRLVKACHTSIKDHKLGGHLEQNKEGPPSDGLVFAQLYKLTRLQLDGNPKKPELPEECIKEVLRSVHERAISIDLNPELEEACLPHLTSICNKAQHGEELGCLEENYDTILKKMGEDDECVKLLNEYIQEQDSDYQLDYILMKACEPVIKKNCESELKAVGDGEIDEGGIFACLVEHKFDEDMDEKCFAGIEHHQIVNMQDFNFNTKLRENCKDDFKTHCSSKAKSKAEVIYCLSAVIRNDTLLEHEHRVSKKCRNQLRVDFLALEDTIQMDPEFKQECESDLKRHCKKVKPHPDADANDLYLTCIRAVDPEELVPSCAKYVFKVAKLANAVAGASSHIFRQCKPEIKKFCKSHVEDPETLLTCLDENYEESSKKCQGALDQEEEEDNQDIRLNPALYIPCKKDIEQFCEREMNSVHDSDETLHGAVINCLKLEYLKGEKSGLTEQCQNQMHLLVVRVQTRDYKQDYVLTHHCKKEIAHCTGEGNKEEAHVIECLKKKLFAGELKDDENCQADVFRLITENRVDIFTDKELYDACQHDLRESFCKDIPAGSGRVMSCLLSLYDAKTVKNPKCRGLVKQRKELWEHAAKLSPPETLKQVWDDLYTSDSRWYFMSVVAVVLLIILALGIICGRVSKRVAAEIKNR